MGREEAAAHIVFVLILSSICFIPIPLKNNDVDWIFSRCKMQVDLVSNLVFNMWREMGRAVEENLTSAHGGGFSS